MSDNSGKTLGISAGGRNHTRISERLLFFCDLSPEKQRVGFLRKRGNKDVRFRRHHQQQLLLAVSQSRLLV